MLKVLLCESVCLYSVDKNETKFKRLQLSKTRKNKYQTDTDSISITLKGKWFLLNKQTYFLTPSHSFFYDIALYLLFTVIATETCQAQAMTYNLFIQSVLRRLPLFTVHSKDDTENS